MAPFLSASSFCSSGADNKLGDPRKLKNLGKTLSMPKPVSAVPPLAWASPMSCKRREKLQFYFSRTFFPLLWINHVNHEALWPLQVSPERRKRLTHVWKGEGWSFPPLCVHRHLISEHHGVFWPRWASGHCLLASSQGSR